MNKKEKVIQIALGTYLETQWKEYKKILIKANKLCAEGDKLHAEGSKLYAEGNKLYAEGNKLCAEGNKLLAEGNKLYAEGDKLYAEGRIKFITSIIEVYGNIEIEWEDNYTVCKLSNGVEFK